ncbi:hypothetical protein CHARACLAT_021445 [Characodon lateralis]|uniref:Uncharacterized protein n=1 Tax=Characodon lateralis TaxID=208331 RepID=A0ABU7DW66_9TELE|nr:hypothetical protein [Characodon lateralis]
MHIKSQLIIMKYILFSIKNQLYNIKDCHIKGQGLGRMVEFFLCHSAMVTLADQTEGNNLSYEAILSCLDDIFQMIGMIMAFQNVSIDDAIVDPPRASIQDFSGVWHNHRGSCVMFSVSPSTVRCGPVSRQSRQPTLALIAAEEVMQSFKSGVLEQRHI